MYGHHLNNARALTEELKHNGVKSFNAEYLDAYIKINGWGEHYPEGALGAIDRMLQWAFIEPYKRRVRNSDGVLVPRYRVVV